MANDDVIDDDVISNQINDDFDAYTPLEDVLEDDILPTPQRNPSRAAAGAGIAKLVPTFGDLKAYSTLRLTSEDSRDTSIVGNDDCSK